MSQNQSGPGSLSAPNSPARRLTVRHKTIYTYDRPVQRSIHKLHLRPMHDFRQHLLNYSLTIDPKTPAVEYEDVFGNFATRFEITQPYTQLTVEARSEVELLDMDPFAFAKTMARPTLPVHWMPWELKMLTPYLTSQELPDTQLSELYAYAVSIAEKNKNDLLETLFSINLTLFREFQYVPGSTSIATTPWDVLNMKRGVCQDFANLFITLARLLGLPARYVCGYIYTGNVGQARAQSDASHAWVQVFIPQVGWKGFDPTNGILPDGDHVRTGVGRNYRDTAPTAGTIYSPAVESLTIDVEVNDPQREDGNVSRDNSTTIAPANMSSAPRLAAAG